MANLAAFMAPATLSLESQLTRIALESEYSVNMVETFRSLIPNFAQNFHENTEQLKQFISEFMSSGDNLTRSQKKILNGVAHMNFLSFSDMLVSVPMNFNGHFVKYAELLNYIADLAFKSENSALNEYNLILSSFLTNKEDKISLKDHTAFFKRLEQDRIELENRMSIYLPKDTGITKQKLKDVIERFADLEPLFREVQKLAGAHKQAQMQKLYADTQQTNQLLSMIIDGVRKGHITNVGPAATNNIAQGAYEVANHVRFIGTVYFTVSVFLSSMDKFVEQLSEKIKSMS